MAMAVHAHRPAGHGRSPVDDGVALPRYQKEASCADPTTLVVDLHVQFALRRYQAASMASWRCSGGPGTPGAALLSITKADLLQVGDAR